jgi:hypothetical protein
MFPDVKRGRGRFANLRIFGYDVGIVAEGVDLVVLSKGGVLASIRKLFYLGDT